jgi:tetratricopeptide (TPR) repeat protein
MDIYTTVEEKYLQAVEELQWGELPKALQYFNEIIAFDPDYARAYFHLGTIYHYNFKNYQTAGYYYKKCVELESEFPDVYEYYLKLAMTLKMHKLVKQIAEKALSIAGVCEARIYESLGLHAEHLQNFAEANSYFKKAELLNANQEEQTLFQEHQKRIKNKINSEKAMIYDLQG